MQRAEPFGGSALQRRTLWQALDTDRAKWWYFGAYVVLAALLIAFVSWLWTLSDGDSRSTEALSRVIAAILPAVFLPVVRRRALRNAKDSLGAVEIPADVFPETSSALHDMAIATGNLTAQLGIFASESLNALVMQRDGVTKVHVSLAFTRLPIDEQRAAFAMLLGRQRVAIDSLLVGAVRNGMPITDDGSVITRALMEREPRMRQRVAHGFTEVAVAGDREALLMLKEPAPLFTLLTRLTTADRTLPAVDVPAVHTCLAWPLGDATSHDRTSKRPVSISAQRRVNEALATALPNVGDPDVLRLERLKHVVPVAETIVRPPAPLAPALARPAAPAAAIDAPAPAVRPVAAAAPVTAPRAATGRQRMAMYCPKCRASNAPMNKRCIACGAPLA